MFSLFTCVLLGGKRQFDANAKFQFFFDCQSNLLKTKASSFLHMNFNPSASFRHFIIICTWNAYILSERLNRGSESVYLVLPVTPHSYEILRLFSSVFRVARRKANIRHPITARSVFIKRLIVILRMFRFSHP